MPTVTRMWAPKGTQPLIPACFGKRERKTLFGAVNLKTGKLLGQITDKGNAATFQRFLGAICQCYRKRHIVVILDNIKFHHAKKINYYLTRHRRISFLFLPPYYPKLNPQEMVWQIMRRRVTHCVYYPDFKQEISAAKRFFKNTVVKIKNSYTSLIIRS